MGAHRKAKAKPVTVAAVVTAAVVTPVGTAAAATYGGFSAVPSTAHGLSNAGNLLVTKVGTASVAKPKITTSTIVAAVPVTTAAAPKPSASPAPSATKPAAPAPAPSSTAPTVASAANQYKNVTLASLEPTGLYGTQQYFTANATQWANAKTIVAVTEQRGMPLYAAVIAMSTAMQESSLTNLTMATNADSLGLFQQRPSQGWGTAAQLTDPNYATNAFLAALEVYAPNYADQALWVSAQAVQRSGFPTAYAQWQDQTAKMVLAIVNGTAP
jgi:hypothetical protein